MKSYKNKIQVIIAVLFILGLTLNASAQTTSEQGENTGKKKYALLVRNTEHMGAALKTASQMRESGSNYEAFEVVVCGKVVSELIDKENETIPDMLKQAGELNVRFSVCGMSMNKFNISPGLLPEQFEVVNNGLIRIFELQENGYYTIEL
ncbi:DsrE family protein [Catalinimonas sp. 4WD22]|uniref:DsrE family protein n=1 Tax=Catalinimonas locisalis TaxID=3133978 RepID=UPI003101ACF8